MIGIIVKMFRENFNFRVNVYKKKRVLVDGLGG